EPVELPLSLPAAPRLLRRRPDRCVVPLEAEPEAHERADPAPGTRCEPPIEVGRTLLPDHPDVPAREVMDGGDLGVSPDAGEDGHFARRQFGGLLRDDPGEPPSRRESAPAIRHGKNAGRPVVGPRVGVWIRPLPLRPLRHLAGRAGTAAPPDLAPEREPISDAGVPQRPEMALPRC